MSRSPATPVDSRSLLPLYGAHAIVHLSVGLYPAVLVVLRAQFDASYATLGAVFAVATAIYGFGALPAGLLTDRVAPVRMIEASMLGIALATSGLALAPDETWFAVALFCLGAACAPYHAAALTLMSRSTGNDAHVLAHHGMLGNIGLAAAPTFGALLAWAVSWRLAFGGAALLAVFALVALWRRLPELDGGLRAPAPAGAPSESDRTHRGALTLVLAITIALGFVFRGFATYLPALSAQRVEGLPASGLVAGGVLASLVYATGFFGQWWGGHLGGHRNAHWIYVGLLAAGALLLGAAFLTGGPGFVLLMAAFSFTHFCCQPIDNTFTGRFTSHRRRGAGYGLSFTLSFGVGSLAAWVCGAVADAAGGRLRFVLLPLAAAALMAALTAAVLALVTRASGGDAANARDARGAGLTG